jgi:VanZ family protein
MGSLSLFGMLAFLRFPQSTHSKTFFIPGDMLMLACATELAQLFVEGRGALVFDVSVDRAGCASGASTWLVFERIRTQGFSLTHIKKVV